MKLNGTPHIITKRKVIWKMTQRLDGTQLACPADEEPIKRYVIYNPQNKRGLYKEVGSEMATIFEDCKDIHEACERALKL